MRRLCLALALASISALPACTMNTEPATAGSTVPSGSPVTPLGNTLVDERAIQFGFAALATVSSAAEVMMDAGLIQPGSDRAHAAARAMEATLRWLNAASAAQKAGNAYDAATAFKRAQEALGNVRTALGLK